MVPLLEGVDKAIISEWSSIKRLVDERIEALVQDLDRVYLREVARYIVEGGKRFRGFLTILLSRASGGELEDSIDAAIAIELVHSASLAIDDMVDLDSRRRGKPSAWVAYTSSKASLASLLLIAVAQRIVERYGFTAIKSVIRAWEDTVRGEILEAFHGDSLGDGDYLRVIELKTASLFKLAAELGVISSGREDLLDHAGRYGRLLGLIYQLSDDLVDYVTYTRAGKKLGPGELLYLKWIKRNTDGASIIDSTIPVIKTWIKEAQTLALELASPRYQPILVELPVFISSKMLQEAGLELAGHQ